MWSRGFTVTVELITDGVHLQPALYREVSRSVGPDRVALVTDAMAAAGMADGAYRLGSLAVAGSTARIDHVLRYAVENSGRPRADAILAAVRQPSVKPARALGLSEAGLAVGAPADLVVMHAELVVIGLVRKRSWVAQTVSDGRGAARDVRSLPPGSEVP